jgi:hypothetical protein
MMSVMQNSRFENRYRGFSKSFNRWLPGSLLDPTLVEKFDKAYPTDKHPSCFVIGDEKTRWIVSYSEYNECESSEDESNEEEEHGFERKKRRKPVRKYAPQSLPQTA